MPRHRHDIISDIIWFCDRIKEDCLNIKDELQLEKLLTILDLAYQLGIIERIEE
jgi:hypothetical protein